MITLSDIQKGYYRGIPPALYEIMVQATIHKEKRPDKLTFREYMTFRKFERPGALEDALRFFRVGGVKITTEVDPDNKQSLFEKSYRIDVNVDVFLNDCTKFYGMDYPTIYKVYYDMLMKEVAAEEARRKAADRDAIIKRLVKRKHPRENDVVCYRRKISDVNYMGYTY